MKPSNLVLRIGRLCGACVVMVWFSLSCLGQGTFLISFDGSPLIQPGTARIVQQYYESGMSFTPIDPDAPFAGFVRRKGGGTPPPDWPDNGTAYLQAGAIESLKFNFVNDSLFGVSSVDLASWNGENPDFAVHFIGYRQDGSVVTADFSGTGNEFRTFYFGPAFTGLSRVEVPPLFGWSLDNLVVSIPEPRSGALLTIGSLLAVFRCWSAARSRRRGE
jgi:hypothetical protein